jgi:molybdenum cofactor cytidylyltransferase
MVSCIVLAAGTSARFGSPKPLALFHAKPVIEVLQEKLLQTQLSEIIIVLGHEAERIRGFLLKEPRIRSVINRNYLLGQTSSFKTGLKTLDPRSRGIMLLPADMPALKAATCDELITIFLKKPCLACVPVFESRKGHPPIFSCSLKEEFMRLKDEEPIATVLRDHGAEIVKVPVADEGVILSFNTPSELQDIMRKLKFEDRS